MVVLKQIPIISVPYLKPMSEMSPSFTIADEANQLPFHQWPDGKGKDQGSFRSTKSWDHVDPAAVYHGIEMPINVQQKQSQMLQYSSDSGASVVSVTTTSRGWYIASVGLRLQFGTILKSRSSPIVPIHTGHKPPWHRGLQYNLRLNTG